MLTKELSIVAYDFRTGQVVPDRLTQARHASYRLYAERMLDVYRRGIGQTRRQLHRSIHSIFAQETDCPVRRIDAFCKLLDDVSQYQRDSRGKAAALRKQVFELAAAYHPLVEHADRFFEHDQHQIKQEIARQLGRSWDEIDRSLFDDVIDFHRLLRFDGYADAAGLLARYNVAQIQTALYAAHQMVVWASEDFKTILRYAKLARLMHSITKLSDGRFRIRLDGPASLLRQTRRYGAQMARFLPALIACRGWRMVAEVRSSRRAHRFRLELTAMDGLHSHLPPPEDFDSVVESAFAERWGDAEHEGWRLTREGEILFQDQKIFVPDFVFEHASGLRVPLEIIGFWTPEYLQAKRETLKVFRDTPMILAVASPQSQEMPALGTNTIIYKTRLKTEAVLTHLRRFLAAS